MEEGDSRRMTMAKLQEPLLSPQKGGFRTMPFIIAKAAFGKAASVALGPNMILYLTREYGMQSSDAANWLFYWSAADNFIPIVGALLADSYVGRFRMIGFGTIVSLLGMVLLWLTTLQPSIPPSEAQLILLYSSFALMSVGFAGIRASSIAFGADQVVNLKDSNILGRFFGWYYATSLTSSMVAVTCIVYIQEKLGWTIGFGVPVVLMLVSAICFFTGSPIYIKMEVGSNLLIRFAQVVVASYRNRNVELPSTTLESGSFYRGKGSVLREPTPKLRFLNRACFMPQGAEDYKPPNPWSHCTVDQVEEFKSVVNIIPIWSTGISMSIVCSQGSFSVLQASAMDRHITQGFEIPMGSFSTFAIVAVLLQVSLCNKIIPKLASKVTGRPTRLGLKHRMGTGLVLSVAATSALAIAEFFRRKMAIEGAPPLSALWLVPSFVFFGFAEGFNGIGQNEFYYSQLPKTMSSVASTLFGLANSVASLFSSFIVCAVDSATKVEGRESWVSSNIDKGHYDYYYWVISCLGLGNFGYFLVCCRAYGPCKEDSDETLH